MHDKKTRSHTLGTTMLTQSTSTPPTGWTKAESVKVPIENSESSSDMQQAADAVNRIADAAENLVDETEKDRHDRKWLAWLMMGLTVINLSALWMFLVRLDARIDEGIGVVKQLELSNQAAVEARVARQVAVQAKVDAEEEEFTAMTPDEEAAADKAKQDVEQLEAKAVEAELEAVRVLPKPPPALVKHLEKKAKKAENRDK